MYSVSIPNILLLCKIPHNKNIKDSFIAKLFRADRHTYTHKSTCPHTHKHSDDVRNKTLNRNEIEFYYVDFISYSWYLSHLQYTCGALYTHERTLLVRLVILLCLLRLDLQSL